jgi:uncharacterized protein YcgL (UPF0745 family)
MRDLRATQPVTCWIYRSSRNADTFLYLRRPDAFDELPVALRERFGRPEFVMTLGLTATRKLARNNARQVMQDLAEQGFHLQLPPPTSSVC